jgi:MscS family membrane protein
MRALRTLRLLAPVAWLIIAGFYAGSVAAADVDWSGSWETKWRDGGASGPQTIGQCREGNLPFVRRRGGSSCKRSRADRQVDGRAALRLVHICNGTRGAYVRRALRQRGMVDRARVSGAAPTLPIDQSDVRETVRTFIRGGNLARAGLVENLGAAAAVLDLSKWPGPVLTNQRLEIARNLFDVVSLTTFQIWNLQGLGCGTHRSPPSCIRREPTSRFHWSWFGNWSIVAPTEDELSAARKALLVRSGGRRPEPSAYLKLGSARDTYARRSSRRSLTGIEADREE